VCERNGELVAAQAKEAELLNKSHLQNYDYPQVNVSHDLLKPSITRESARSAFLEHDDTMRQRLLHAWYEHGVSGVLEELSQVNEKEKALWVSNLASRLLAVVRFTSSLHGWFFPHLAMSNEDLIAEFSPSVNWKESAVRQFAWHPHTAKFALALHDDSVRVYTAKKLDIVPILKHRLQKGVADLAWKPLSASVLAVACQSCVLIWHVDPMSLATRPSTSSVQVLSQNGHSPVTSVAWCPQGGVLISASPADTAMMVWDVALETCIPLRRFGGGGVSLLRWSPEGSKLFAACPSPVFRVWECRQWSCEKWTNLLSRCKAACWSPDGSALLFATASEPIIYSLTFTASPSHSQPAIGGSKVAITSADLSELEVETQDGPVRVGGLIQSLAWDPSGERLAVQFKSGSTDLIALFQTRLHPILELVSCGYVRGLPCEVPYSVSFQPNFNQGALLTVVWSSGRIAFIPLYFLRRQAVEDRIYMDPHALNGHVTGPLMYSTNQ